MATVNFSVPESVKRAFNETFRGENKSAILSRLMQEAIERRERQHRRRAAIEAILELRDEGTAFPDETVRKVRRTGRP